MFSQGQAGDVLDVALERVENILLQRTDASVLCAEDVDAAVLRKKSVCQLESQFTTKTPVAGKTVERRHRVDDASEHEGEGAVLDVAVLRTIRPCTIGGVIERFVPEAFPDRALMAGKEGIQPAPPRLRREGHLRNGELSVRDGVEEIAAGPSPVIDQCAIALEQGGLDMPPPGGLVAERIAISVSGIGIIHRGKLLPFIRRGDRLRARCPFPQEGQLLRRRRARPLVAVEAEAERQVEGCR